MGFPGFPYSHGIPIILTIPIFPCDSHACPGHFHPIPSHGIPRDSHSHGNPAYGRQKSQFFGLRAKLRILNALQNPSPPFRKKFLATPWTPRYIGHFSGDRRCPIWEVSLYFVYLTAMFRFWLFIACVADVAVADACRWLYSVCKKSPLYFHIAHLRMKLENPKLPEKKCPNAPDNLCLIWLDFLYRFDLNFYSTTYYINFLYVKYCASWHHGRYCRFVQK